MSAPDSWNVLRTAGADALVVACDFAAAGRPIATFTELVALLPGGFTVWETAPPPYGQEAGMTGADQVDRWAVDLRASGRPVHAVLGFCSGSAYAGALAGRIARWQQPARLVLLDPERATPAMMLDFYQQRVHRFASVLTPDEVDSALRAGRDAVAADAVALEAAGDARALALAGRLRELCRLVVEPACDRVGLGRERSAEFVGLSGAYLYWLAAAMHIDAGTEWAGATALNGATAGVGLHSYPPTERAGLVAGVRYLDVSHTDLMRSSATACAVAELLN